MVQRYEVLAINPETQAAEWVDIGSPEAATWEATVAADGAHGRFVEVPEDAPKETQPLDLTQSPFLTWTGMQPLPKSATTYGDSLVRSTPRAPRRWVLLDKRTGAGSRAYTAEELMDRLRRRAKSTVAKKRVYDNVTHRQWDAKRVLANPEIVTVIEQEASR